MQMMQLVWPASRKVIEANGGTPIERFYKPAPYDGAESLRFRISLANDAVGRSRIPLPAEVTT